MIEKKDIEHLAKLSRIELNDKSVEGLAKDIESILGYVDQIKEVSADLAVRPPSAGENRNVLREDENPHESGIYTEKILKESPDREGDFIKVKNIL
jgi:aspartyl-tRNA(Asn)/glutamyl-tRNA(Gln) amidotransferase subunit C